MKYKATLCLSNLNSFISEQINREAIGGWKFISMSTYQDNGTWKTNLVYGLDNKDS